MNDTTSRRRRALSAAIGVAFAYAGGPVLAQDAPGSAGSLRPDPNPYYVGVSQGLTHDSNVYRIPSGQGDNYSSTSLFGGFEQPISRQRIFGSGSVSVNRYQDQSQLDNTSYSLGAGADWATIENLSGNLNVGLNRNLAAQAATAGVPTEVRNIATTENADARVRWGGRSLLTLEGSVGYSRLNYSAPQSVSAQSKGRTGSLALYYRPGALLRMGLAGRVNRTESPKAFFDPTTGTYQGNTVKGKNLDLLADYDVSGQLTANGRLSYTRQSNSGVGTTDFSGLTGSLGVGYRPTAKTSLRFDVSRDAGFDAALFNTSAVSMSNGVPVVTVVDGRYENNRTTDSLGVGISYEATAKISANAGARYSRVKLLTTSVVGGVAQPGPESIDKLSSFSLGANYAISRSWGLGCNAAYSHREVTGIVPYSYSANSIGCTTQFTWR